MANRNKCFSDFSKQKTAKERWHSFSQMDDREEYLETPLPLPLPPPPGGTAKRKNNFLNDAGKSLELKRI